MTSSKDEVNSKEISKIKHEIDSLVQNGGPGTTADYSDKEDDKCIYLHWINTGYKGFGSKVMRHLIDMSDKKGYGGTIKLDAGYSSLIFHLYMGFIPVNAREPYVSYMHGYSGVTALRDLNKSDDINALKKCSENRIKTLKKILAYEKGLDEKSITLEHIMEHRTFLLSLFDKKNSFIETTFIPKFLSFMDEHAFDDRPKTASLIEELGFPADLGMPMILSEQARKQWLADIQTNKDFTPYRKFEHLRPYMTKEQVQKLDKILDKRTWPEDKRTAFIALKGIENELREHESKLDYVSRNTLEATFNKINDLKSVEAFKDDADIVEQREKVAVLYKGILKQFDKIEAFYKDEGTIKLQSKLHEFKTFILNQTSRMNEETFDCTKEVLQLDQIRKEAKELSATFESKFDPDLSTQVYGQTKLLTEVMKQVDDSIKDLDSKSKKTEEKVTSYLNELKDLVRAEQDHPGSIKPKHCKAIYNKLHQNKNIVLFKSDPTIAKMIEGFDTLHDNLVKQVDENQEFRKQVDGLQDKCESSLEMLLADMDKIFDGVTDVQVKREIEKVKRELNSRLEYVISISLDADHVYKGTLHKNLHDMIHYCHNELDQFEKRFTKYFDEQSMLSQSFTDAFTKIVTGSGFDTEKLKSAPIKISDAFRMFKNKIQDDTEVNDSLKKGQSKSGL